MYKNIFVGLILCSSLPIMQSCQENNSDMENSKTNNTVENHGIDLHFMDTTISPKEDFYNFVNGTWMQEVEIPSDHNSWGSFIILRKNTDETMLSLLREAMTENSFPEGSDQEKAFLLFQSKLDSVSREEVGLTPFQPVLEKIEQISDLVSLQKIISENPVEIAHPFFSIYASPKPEDSKMNGVKFYPGSLGLPDRDYYIKEDSKSKEIREQYKTHIAKMLGYLGIEAEEATAKAERILALETRLAEPRMTKEERRDARKQNNPKSIAQLTQMLPAIDWQNWLDNLPVKKEIDTIVVTQVNYATALQEILTSEKIENIRDLVLWQTLNNATGRLTVELEYANWEFYGKTLKGMPQQRPADERALAMVNGAVGEALGKIYVEKEFPEEAKKTAEEMVENVIATFEDRINNLEWMTDETKERAKEKLATLVVKIGYPDKWKDYSSMEIKKGNSFYENAVAAAKWRLNDNLSKINEPVNRTEWFMSPQTVNAYYSSSLNEIVFPAAILQPPFFDYKADAAVNFGGIGAVIGHEISHAFDDSGSRFDADGNLNNWWTDEDLQKFEERTQKLADFYSSIQVEDSLYLNGTFTLGENTADLGGVLSAYNGLQRYYETHERPEDIGGFSQEQRFFISWATVWRNKTREEALRMQINTDPHAPGKYRAYLPLQNVDEFYEAFDIQSGDKMYIAPEDRIRIW